jgi:hypothetical protein
VNSFLIYVYAFSYVHSREEFLYKDVSLSFVG